MIKFIKPYKKYMIGDIVGLGCAKERILIDKGIAMKLKLPVNDVKSKN
jgi:hypothetical protein